MIWKNKPDLTLLNEFSRGTAVEHMGIAFTEIGDDYLRASMPVDHRTRQPAGLLHGGASVLLAETLGSVASALCGGEAANAMPVGLEINASHLKAVREGQVYGTCRPVRIGKRVHVWQIEITTASNDPVCSCRLTTIMVSA